MTDLNIVGYASRFDERDLGGDTVRRGAFSAALLSRTDPYPMLYAHDTQTPVGVWERVVEDEIGLLVEGRLQGGTPETDRLIALIQSGAVSGLSIGYRTRRSRPAATGRDLFEIELWEISLVAFPMLPTARIFRADTPLTPAQDQERIAA